MAIHNLKSVEDRRVALEEIARVLRPGGRVVIADLRHAKAYSERFRELGFDQVESRNLGPLMWFGGPWQGTSVVTGCKPQS